MWRTVVEHDVADPRGRHAPLAEAAVEVAGEGREDRLGQDLGVGLRARLAHQHGHVRAPGRVQPAAVARAGGGRLGADDQLGVLLQQGEQRAEEGVEALPGGRARPERGRAPQDQALQLALGVLQQRQRQPGPVAEAPEERALADARGGGDLVHRHRVDAALGEEAAGGLQDARAVAGGVGPLGGSGGEWH